MKSIQWRLSVGLALLLVLVGVLLAQGSLLLFDRGLRDYLQGNLRDETTSLLRALVRGSSGLQLDPQRLDPAFLRQFSGHYFRIDFQDQHWRSRSLWDHALDRPAQDGLLAGLADGPAGQQLLVYRADYRRFGQPVSITVAQDYTPLLQAFRQLQWLGLGLGGTALLLILLGQRYIVQRSLRPLERVRQQIGQLQEGRRSTLDAAVPHELEPLVRQINRLLLHTEDSLRRSRTALGNLGHALKTPLAVLVGLTSRPPLQDSPELRAALLEQLAQIQQRLGRELGRARLAGEALPGAHFDCAAELPGLCSTLTVIHAGGIELDWHADAGLCLPWDREDLLELLGNLLDNACKWAGSRVSLQISRQDRAFWLQVDDDGPGIAPDQREEVLARGMRLDEQTAGHGLGLAIVRDMLQAWGGQLSLADSPLGGLRVVVRLPDREPA